MDVGQIHTGSSSIPSHSGEENKIAANLEITNLARDGGIGDPEWGGGHLMGFGSVSKDNPFHTNTR